MNGVENSIGMKFYDMGMEHLHVNGIEGANFHEWEMELERSWYEGYRNVNWVIWEWDRNVMEWEILGYLPR